jgi:hypothetical protein
VGNLVLGIDPGNKGAFVWVDKKGNIIKKVVMPLLKDKKKTTRKGKVNTTTKISLDIRTIYALLVENKDKTKSCFIEKAQVFPGQGGVSNFNYGYGNGVLVALLTVSGYDFTLVPPKTWTSVLHAPVAFIKDAKQKSKMIALKLKPESTYIYGTRSKIPHEGIIDAFLIAEYGRGIENAKT